MGMMFCEGDRTVPAMERLPLAMLQGCLGMFHREGSVESSSGELPLLARLSRDPGLRRGPLVAVLAGAPPSQSGEIAPLRSWPFRTGSVLVDQSGSPVPAYQKSSPAPSIPSGPPGGIFGSLIFAEAMTSSIFKIIVEASPADLMICFFTERGS